MEESCESIWYCSKDGDCSRRRFNGLRVRTAVLQTYSNAGIPITNMAFHLDLTRRAFNSSDNWRVSLPKIGGQHIAMQSMRNAFLARLRQAAPSRDVLANTSVRSSNAVRT